MWRFLIFRRDWGHESCRYEWNSFIFRTIMALMKKRSHEDNWKFIALGKILNSFKRAIQTNSKGSINFLTVYCRKIGINFTSLVNQNWSSTAWNSTSWRHSHSSLNACCFIFNLTKNINIFILSVFLFPFTLNARARVKYPKSKFYFSLNCLTRSPVAKIIFLLTFKVLFFVQKIYFKFCSMERVSE